MYYYNIFTFVYFWKHDVYICIKFTLATLTHALSSFCRPCIRFGTQITKLIYVHLLLCKPAIVISYDTYMN